MPAPLKLFDAFQKGEIQVIDLKGPLSYADVPIGKKWLILRGWFRHITGTGSIILIRGVRTPIMNGCEILKQMLAAADTEFYPLYETKVSAYENIQQPYTMPILQEGERLQIDGHANIFAKIWVLEW